jgi:peptidoglycan/LPS O-acetylase OafA/YrhL
MNDCRDQVPFIQSRASVALDAIRGVAALLVTLEHLRQRLRFAPYTARSPHAVIFRLLFVLSSFGHAAVIVFFVLSGFLVGGSLLRSHQNQTWTWKNYLTQRIVRLWIVLIPALLIGFAWDSLTVYVGHLRHNPAVVAARVAETEAYLTTSSFFGNMFFLQDTFVPIFGSNGALWSLKNEFWYYIIFPLAIFALFPKYKRTVRLLFAAAAVLLLIGIGRASSYAPLWLLGALLFYSPRIHFNRSKRRVALALYGIAFLCLHELAYHLPYTADYLLAIATCTVIWILLSARSAADPQIWSTRGVRLLAKFSYTLYLIHIPILTFVGVCLVQDQYWQPTIQHLALAFVLWIAIIAFAYLIASLTEFRTDKVRRWVESWSFEREPMAKHQVS